MAQVLHVDADLVRAAGEEVAFDEARVSAGRADGVLGDGVPSGGGEDDGHLLAVAWISANAVFNATLVERRPALDDRRRGGPHTVAPWPRAEVALDSAHQWGHAPLRPRDSVLTCSTPAPFNPPTPSPAHHLVGSNNYLVPVWGLTDKTGQIKVKPSNPRVKLLLFLLLAKTLNFGPRNEKEETLQ